MKSIDKLTDAQVLALSEYIRAQGKLWRERIIASFNNEPAALPQQLRSMLNKHTTTILPCLATVEVLRDGDTVKREWSTAPSNPVVRALIAGSEVLS